MPLDVTRTEDYETARDFDGEQHQCVLGGDPRDPQIVRCHRVIDSLHRDGAGHWHVDARRTEGHAKGQPPGAEPA
jgi:hypothetical protein